jgi:hypothetical protein
MLKRNPEERLLRGLGLPPPPPGLRRRALAAARTAAAGRAAQPGIWTRVWAHRGLRAAWATAVLLLLAAHLVISVADSRNDRTPSGQPAFMVVAAVADEELEEVVGLSRIAGDSLIDLDIERRQDNDA